MKPLVVFLVFAAGLAAQTPQRPAVGVFEVASIKLDPKPAGRFIRMQTATQFTVHNHTVRTLLAAAYHLSPNEILGGPPLVDSDHWAIVAKTPRSPAFARTTDGHAAAASRGPFPGALSPRAEGNG